MIRYPLLALSLFLLASPHIMAQDADVGPQDCDENNPTGCKVSGDTNKKKDAFFGPFEKKADKKRAAKAEKENASSDVQLTDIILEPIRMLREGERLTPDKTSRRYEMQNEDECKRSGLDGCTGFRYSTQDYRARITKPLTQPTVSQKPDSEQTLLDRVLDYIVFTPGDNALLILPILDSSKDLGPNVGVMPILAMRNQKTKSINSVIAPSVNYNKYLKTTLTYRHYYFPGNDNLIVGRVAISEVVQKDLFFRYFNPKLFGTDYRLNAELRYWVNGKASFYGVGPNTSDDNKATFALDTLGEEVSLGIPLVKNLYVEFMQSFYRNKTSKGPLDTSPQLQTLYPDVFDQTKVAKNFQRQKLSLFYDSTDHPFIPKLGTYAGASIAAGVNGFGSDYSYAIYGAQLKQYYNYKQENRFVTAFNTVFQQQVGNNLPFYTLPTLGEKTGFRAAGDGRFVDRGKLVFNLEERITLFSMPVLQFFTDMEVTPFAEYGTVFYSPDQMQANEFQLGYGLAFRAIIRPQVVCTAEFAFGKEGNNIIINVDYPF